MGHFWNCNSNWRISPRRGSLYYRQRGNDFFTRKLIVRGLLSSSLALPIFTIFPFSLSFSVHDSRYSRESASRVRRRAVSIKNVMKRRRLLFIRLFSLFGGIPRDAARFTARRDPIGTRSSRGVLRKFTTGLSGMRGTKERASPLFCLPLRFSRLLSLFLSFLFPWTHGGRSQRAGETFGARRVGRRFRKDLNQS